MYFLLRSLLPNLTEIQFYSVHELCFCKSPVKMIFQTLHRVCLLRSLGHRLRLRRSRPLCLFLQSHMVAYVRKCTCKPQSLARLSTQWCDHVQIKKIRGWLKVPSILSCCFLWGHLLQILVWNFFKVWLNLLLYLLYLLFYSIFNVHNVTL